ncbi:hypothetical protein R3P38DRAFT_3453826, partial [Favolaschia claudopus]
MSQVRLHTEGQVNAALAWFSNPQGTIAQALELLDTVPPLVLGVFVSYAEKVLPPLRRVTMMADWIDNQVDERKPALFTLVVEQRYKSNILSHLLRSRIEIQGEDFNEKITDDFHLHQILVPAVELAQAIRPEADPITASPANQANITGDLFVYTKGKRERGYIWVAIEDKTSSVFAKHQDEFLGLIHVDPFPFPKPSEMDSAPAGVRMWIQIWGQMVTYDAYFAKVFSPIGVLYIQRQSNSDELLVSRLYDNLDGEVSRTLNLILEACEQGDRIATQALTIPGRVNRIHRLVHDFILNLLNICFLLLLLLFRLWAGRRGVYILQYGHATFLSVIKGTVGGTVPLLPTVFMKWLGEGATGFALGSLSGSYVIKVFQNPDLAFHEAHILDRTRGIPNVPSVHGIVSNGATTGVILSYEETPV